MHTRTRCALGVTATVALVASLAGSAVAQEPVSLTWLVDDSTPSQQWAHGLADAYMAQNPDVTITIENRQQGGDGDNVVKTRLATGEMTDLFWYNAGSLFQALNPTETLVDLSDAECIGNISDSFIPTVSAGDGIYGVPNGTAMGGGILYNKRVYEDLGLEIPTTWEQFAANNEAIKAAGIAPVAASFADTWTSQLFVLGDFYNVLAADPEWADKYTGNQVKYATDPVALAGFQHTQEGFDKGWWQEDYDVATYDEALGLLAEGQAAHYPMLTFALGTISTNFPEAIDDIGFFAQPGTDAENAGATIWMPAGSYIPKTTENVEAATDFLCFIASVEGTEAQTASQSPAGPYVIEGASLPEDAMSAVFDVASYLDEGKAAPALEFLSPIKGPQLEHILIEVGSGLRSAEDGAALYDQDVQKQALQLGLEGWE